MDRQLDRADVDHTPARPQSWPAADDDIRTWCLDTVRDLVDAVGQVSAVYLHGSLATGSYYRPKSDLDLLVVASTTLDEQGRSRFVRAALDCFDRRPTVGGLEVSVLSHAQLSRFRHPMAYEAHFSEKWADAVRGGHPGPTGTDPDLAAHLTVARHRGVTLMGAPPDDVLPPVPVQAFRAAVFEDFEWIVADDHVVESPYYGVLNICRTLQLLADPGAVASKDEGAAWALGALPAEHRPVVREALACYHASSSVAPELRRTHGHAWDPDPLRALRDVARHEVALGRGGPARSQARPH